ncbi:CCA tRNA nucleotidyltransferase, partial [Paenibacillus koleovorans]|uniref:CCA tRNA nucleotidyltransferase n=1 Tax=Paenibacillus koleovorans TaxID=121608 RepID=UPI000FD8CCA9
MTERMEQAGRRVVERLVSSGCEAYWVGGCVRDKLLGRPLKDIDIATSAKPDDVLRLFAHAIPTGLQHGTVTVVEDGMPYEVTTFRREAAYEDHRRPTGVEFISELNEDLRRRDFTINAMALDASGALIDPFGGQADLRRSVLRCVGEPQERFEEDALRMLRCIRFACEYGMTIEERTWLALLDQAPLLRHIAMERVHAELERIVGGAGPDRGVELLASSELLAHTKEALDWPIATAAAGGRAVESPWNGRLAELDAPELRWAYWLLRQGVDSAQAKAGFARLRFSTGSSASIVKLLQVQEWMEAWLLRGGEAGASKAASASLASAGAGAAEGAGVSSANARADASAGAAEGEGAGKASADAERAGGGAEAPALREALARASVRYGAGAV